MGFAFPGSGFCSRFALGETVRCVAGLDGEPCPPLVRGQWRAQWWVTRSSSAVVILASPNTDTHSPNSRLVVMMTLVRSYSLLRRWKSNAPPEALNDRWPCAAVICVPWV